MLKNLLITGGFGFIGLNATKKFLEDPSYDNVLVIDDLKYGQNIKNIPFINNPKLNFYKTDINNSEVILNLIRKYKISHLVHFVAESHVDKSILDPDIFINSNIVGTFKLLDSFKNYWLENGKKAN